MMFMGFEGLDGSQAAQGKKVAFGSGEPHRPIYPNQIPYSRFGNEETPFRGVRNVGPGQYNNHETTTFTNEKKPMSLKGYVLGARTAKKEAYQIRDFAPSPTHYQNLEKPLPKPSFKPFNSSDLRFQNDFQDTKPGPGTYEHNVERNRSVRMMHSFGGRAQSVPHVNIRCTVYGGVKCTNCNEKPVGDFYQFKQVVLCDRCYEYNYKWQEKYDRPYLSSFKKTRDCSFLHEHEGTTAVIQKISDKELRKLKRKEAYLSLYWP